MQIADPGGVCPSMPHPCPEPLTPVDNPWKEIVEFLPPTPRLPLTHLPPSPVASLLGCWQVGSELGPEVLEPCPPAGGRWGSGGRVHLDSVVAF